MSINIMSMVKDAVSQQVMNKIGSMVGLDQSKSASAFETAAGSILGGLMNKASSPSGAEAVFGAVQKQDTGILDKLGDLLGGGEATDNFQKQGGGVLDMVFGKNSAQAQQAVGSSLGLGSGMVGKLMSMAAPILMGVIGNYVKSKALNAVGLGSLLGEQKSFLGGMLPSSLTSNLGFGNMLSGASNVAGNVADGVGNVAGSVGNAASNVAGSVGNAASNVAGGVGNVASNVAGGVGNVAGAATGAAGEAASAGGGFLKALLPLVILGAIVYGLWHFLGGAVTGGANAIKDGVGGVVGDGVGAVGDGISAVGDGAGAMAGAVGNGISAVGDGAGAMAGAVGDGVAGAGSGVKNMASGISMPSFEMPEIPGVDLSVLGAQKDALMGPIGEITQGFGGLATGGETAAAGLAEKIGGFGTALEGMGIGNMGAAQKTAVGGILGHFTGAVEGLMANVPGPLQGIVKPAVDRLMETIGGFGL